MPLLLGYDIPVRRRNRATVAGFGLLLIGLLSAAQAQIHGIPPSVTSMGFGGRAINGTPPSVTSLGQRGYTRGFNPAFPNNRPLLGSSGAGNGNPYHHPRHPQGNVGLYGVPYYGYYGVPYYGYDDNGTDADSSAPEDPDNVGPTVLDRRGGYVPPRL
jgi:hypothetical protein